MCGIWPERVINLPGVHSMSMRGADWLDDEMVEAIRSLLGDDEVLDKPVVLDGDGLVRLLALATVGDDALSGERALVVRVTNERHDQTGPVLRLAIMSCERNGPSFGFATDPLLPGQAGDLLDELVERIKAIPGLAQEEIELR